MFTGIVRERGRILATEGGKDGIRLVVSAPQTAGTTAIGDSIALNGTCLTAVAVEEGTIAFDAVPETLRRSSLGSLHEGSDVNVEPALRAGDSLGGHFVQGHVDAVGTVRSVEPEGEGLRLRVDAPPDVLRYAVEKGSIAVDGVSLTISVLDEDAFEVALVPHTVEVTTLGRLAPGDPVNLEADMLAKHVARLAAHP